jgi:hypothetical protein
MLGERRLEKGGSLSVWAGRIRFSCAATFTRNSLHRCLLRGTRTGLDKAGVFTWRLAIRPIFGSVIKLNFRCWRSVGCGIAGSGLLVPALFAPIVGKLPSRQILAFGPKEFVWREPARADGVVLSPPGRTRRRDQRKKAAAKLRSRSHQAGFRGEFSLDCHQESIPEKIVHCHQVLWDFSTLFDRLSKPEDGSTALPG